ncbi:MAG: DUF3617 family protein [Sphingomonadales bacterium]|nr:MAG: DUF3617 family protein [Sphingomonadales bacterium]
MRISFITAALLATTACSTAPTTNDMVVPSSDTAEAIAGATSSQAAPNIAAPKRQAGLWTFTDTAANGDELSTDRLCVGEKSEASYSAFRQIGNGGDCTSRTFTKTATGYSYVTVCGVPGMKPVTTKGTLTGDVATGYTLDEVLDLSVEGDDQKIVAKRVGDCPADLADGQMKDGKMGMVYSVLTR